MMAAGAQLTALTDALVDVEVEFLALTFHESYDMDGRSIYVSFDGRNIIPKNLNFSMPASERTTADCLKKEVDRCFWRWLGMDIKRRNMVVFCKNDGKQVPWTSPLPNINDRGATFKVVVGDAKCASFREARDLVLCYDELAERVEGVKRRRLA